MAGQPRDWGLSGDPRDGALLRQARGSIVTMASTRALQSEPDTEAYAAAKARWSR
ncbi:hypothetical protein FLP41_14710 [Paracoccus marcusii]|uniref:hypothetical protein n=1 Tax=Paracoccus marcusii TaxID=59779 RepID=UPI002ED219E4|nr:hypothetical protein FLP41_14710 [Paracoccus marcusii]